MNCEFNYCIYNNDCRCTLDRVHINELGMCDDCIIVALDEALLGDEKRRQRERIDTA